LKVVCHADPALLALYEAPMALIRPDQILAWRGHHAAQANAKAILAQVMGYGDTVHGSTTDTLPTA
jgi:hypothetical protein